MQNRYTGDIGDYGKLGLLRQLSNCGFTIGVNWYLTPDETHNGDGRHVNYLYSDRLKNCDKQLWDELRCIVLSGEREVKSLESDKILPAKYYSKMLDFSNATKDERTALRWQWHMQAIDELRGCDIIFADPDNGLIVPSADGKPKSNKFVLPFELSDYYRSGASVIYYQHKARKTDDFYIDQHRRLLHSGAFPNAVGFGVKFKTTSQRYYFFVAKPHHEIAVSNCLNNMLHGEWSEHFISLS